MTLDDLSAGARVRITAIRAADPAVQRLMQLGLVEGAELHFLRTSLGGDPLEFELYGVAVSLRRAQARAFDVTTVETSNRAPGASRPHAGSPGRTDQNVSDT